MKQYNIKFRSMIRIEADNMDNASELARKLICSEPEKYLDVEYIMEI